MLLSGPNKFLIALCAVVLATNACSSAKHKQEASDPTAELSATESSADKVGSTPEDMMSNEVGGGDAAAATPAPSTPPADAKDPAAADAFSELQKDAGATNVSDATSTEVSGSQTSELSSSGAADTYKVKAGDTLMKVAFTLYGDIDRWKDIKEWNKEKLKTNQLRKGMVLHVEAGSFQPEQHEHTYTIKKGDTLANIADDVYGRKSKYKKLQKYNAQLIKNPNVIFAGFSLFYDITPKEVAEAEARHNQKLASGGAAVVDPNSPAPASADTASSVVPTNSAPAPMAAPAWPPSAVNPPAPAAAPAPVANNFGSAPATPPPAATGK